MNEIKIFVEHFFTHFKADVRFENNVLYVKMSEPLADFFGQSEFILAFQPQHAIESAELVTQGSYLLGKICEYARQTGIGFYTELPVRFKQVGKIPPEILIRNTYLVKSQLRSEAKFCFSFNFRIEYISDEKVDELYTIHFDWNGQSWTPPAAESAIETVSQLPSAELFEAYDQAKKMTEDYVLRQSVVIEKEVLQRLYKQIQRLDVFYSEQIGDMRSGRGGRGVSDEVQGRIDHLKQEFQLKANEEAQNHRLRIKVDLISYQVWKVPFQRYLLTLQPTVGPPKHAVTADDASTDAQTLSLLRNLHTGLIEPIHCAVCNKETHELILCHHSASNPDPEVASFPKGHFTCPAHSHQCEICGQWECESCGLSKCSQCQINICSACGKKCQVCHKRLCHTHQLTCHRSKEIVCTACSTLCQTCGQITSQPHLERCVICREQACEDCIRECSFCYAHVCQQHLIKCDVCGLQFCVNCGRKSIISDKWLCRSHAVTCQSCERSFSLKEWEVNGTACCVDKEPVCVSCQRVCDACGQAVCAKHTVTCGQCHQTYCRQDAVTCHVCGATMCLHHHQNCPNCHQFTCASDLDNCAICLESFCRRCLDQKNRCVYCHELKFVLTMEVPNLIKTAAVPPEFKKCASWRRSASPTRQIFLGFKDRLAFIIVFDTDGRLLRYRSEDTVKVMQTIMNIKTGN